MIQAPIRNNNGLFEPEATFSFFIGVEAVRALIQLQYNPKLLTTREDNEKNKVVISHFILDTTIVLLLTHF